jgi:hypothetical protein
MYLQLFNNLFMSFFVILEHKIASPMGIYSFAKKSEGNFGTAASPADTRFLSLKQHPESHPN